MSTTTTDLDRVRLALSEVVGQGLALAGLVADAVRPALEGAAPRRPGRRAADPSSRSSTTRDSPRWAPASSPRSVSSTTPGGGSSGSRATATVASSAWSRTPTRTASASTTTPRCPGSPSREGPASSTSPVPTSTTSAPRSTPSPSASPSARAAGSPASRPPTSRSGTWETRLVPALGAASSRLVVVNGDGRILASNTGRHVCGDLLLAADRGAERDVVALDGMPLSVVDLGD